MKQSKPSIKKPEFVMELCALDTSALRTSVTQISDQSWLAETKWRENDYDCFDDTQHIVLMFADGSDHSRSLIKPTWRLWQPTLQPLIDAAVAPYGYTKGKVVKAMFAKLRAGGHIASHIDYVKRDRHVHKIHIPIVTSPEVTMTISERSFHLAEGHAYEVNNLVPHGVENNGDRDRVHFIFEYYDEDVE